MPKKIKEADAILIGASNGLSITEGLHLFADNEAFEKLFGDFKRKYLATAIASLTPKAASFCGVLIWGLSMA